MLAVAWNCRNQSLRCEGRSSSGENRKASVPMRSTGADRSVVAMKVRNGTGAKGSGSDGRNCRNNWRQEDFDACDRQAVHYR